MREFLEGQGRASMVRYLAVLLLLAGIARSPALLLHNFNGDEATYTVMATEMLDGALYLRDVVDHKPPGIYYIYAGIYAAFGRYNRVALHLTLFGVVAATGLCLSLLGARLFDRRAGRLAGLLYVAMSAAGPPFDFFAANGEIFMNLPVVLSLLLYVRARQERRAGYFLAGLSLSLAMLIKFQAGFVVLALALHLCLASGPRLVPALWGLVGLALPLLGHALLYALLGAWDQLSWLFAFNRIYLGATGLEYQLARAVKRTALFIGLQLPLVWAAVDYVVRGRGVARSPTRRAWLLVLAWLVTSGLAVGVGGRYFLHYFVQLLPPLALMAAPRILLGTERRRWVGVAASVVIVLAMLGWSAAAWLDPVLRPAKAWHHERYAAIGRYVQQHTNPGARIFVWGESPEIYMYSKRRMGSRYAWVNYQTGRIWGTPYDRVDAPPPPARLVAWETWPLLIDDLRRRHPDLVIDAAAGKLDDFDRHPLARYPQIAALVQRDYVLETEVLGVPIYRLRSDHPRPGPGRTQGASITSGPR